MSQWYSQDSDKQLNDGEIHIWLNYLNIHQAKLKHLYPLLSDAEKARSEQFKFFKDRKHFIASHGFLHTVLGYYLDTPAEDIQFSYGHNGKPAILEEQNPAQIQFNMSHSNTLAILAVCKQQQLGIDIEFMQRKTDWQGVGKRFFTAKEQQAIAGLPEDQQKEAFFRVWTRKEAHMKVTGEGLHLPPSRFEVTVPPAEAAYLGNTEGETDAVFHMQDIELPAMYKDYRACLSADFEARHITHYIQS